MSRSRDVGEDLGAAVSLGAVAYGFYEPTNSVPDGMFPQILMAIIAVASLVFLGKAVRDLIRQREDEDIHFRLARSSKVLDWIPERAAVKLKLSFVQRQRRAQTRINHFMFDLLQSASKATIVTRDLSWAAAEDPILREIASGGGLRILSCSSAPTPALVEKLRALADMGAEVRRVEKDVRVRLTLTSSSGHERVAVARPMPKRHTILQSSHSDDALFGLATSLIYFLELNSQELPKEA